MTRQWVQLAEGDNRGGRELVSHEFEQEERDESYRLNNSWEGSL